MPEPSARLTVVQTVTSQLRQRILGGIYAPATFMPPERELSLELGASRKSISMALATLAQEGLVEQLRGRGTRILALHDDPDSVIIGVAHVALTSGMSPEALRILEGVEATLSRLHRQYRVLRARWRNSSMSPNSIPIESVHTLADHYRALLFIEDFGAPEQALRIERRKIPLVIANLEDTSTDVSATWVDHGKTTRHALRVLASLGHSRIALFTRPTEGYFYRSVHEAYVAELEALRLPFDPSLIAVSPEPRAFSAYVAAKKFLQEASPRPTAIVAARDYIAEGACRAMAEAGLRVGFDISIIGFDDVSWPEGSTFLTTFKEPTFALGAVAAEMLVERIIHGWRPPERREIEAPFVLRRSAGPCPSAASERPAPEAELLAAQRTS